MHTLAFDVRGGARIVLSPGPALRLVLADGRPALHPGFALVARVSGDDHDVSAAFDETGIASVRLSRAGRFVVGLALTHPAYKGFVAVDGLQWTLLAEDIAEEQSFVSPPFTASFLDALRARREL